MLNYEFDIFKIWPGYILKRSSILKQISIGKSNKFLMAKGQTNLISNGKVVKAGWLTRKIKQGVLINKL